MKRVYTQFFIVLALLLCAALTLSGVAYAKYQKETLKTLTATIQKRWTPKVNSGSWTTTNEKGAVLSFSITNDTSSPKTVTIRLLTDLAPDGTAGTSSDLYIKLDGEAETVYMSAHPLADMGTALQQARNGKEYIYCADATTQECTWTIAPNTTMQGALINPAWTSGTNFTNTQLLVTPCGQ